MGNNHQDREQFKYEDWIKVSEVSNLVTLWQNKAQRNIHIEEHKVYTMDKNELQQELDLYYRRKNHPRWVSALYFREEGTQEFCVSRAVAHVFIEKIPIRLHDLRELPLADVIHVYDQCLHGYEQFSRLYGSFRVLPEYVGVNEMGVVKVWAGQSWAQVAIIGGKINEHDMVRSIVDVIEGAIDQEEMFRSGASIRNFIYRGTDKLTFHRAIYELKQYARTVNNGYIPTRLQSLHASGEYQNFMNPLLASAERNLGVGHGHNNYSTDTINAGMKDHELYTGSRHEHQMPRVTESQVIPQFNMAKQEPVYHHQYPPVDRPRESGPIINYSSQVHPTTNLGAPLQVNFSSVAPPISTHNNHPSNYTFNYQGQMASSGRQRANLLGANQQRGPMISFNSQQPQTTTMRAPSSVNFNNSQAQLRPAEVSTRSMSSLDQPKQQNQMIRQYNNSHYKSNKPIPQSIIMELYRSQDRFGPHESDTPTKAFRTVKRAQSLHEQHPYKFESTTLIKDNYPNTMSGQPSYEYSNLHAIQELSSEHLRHDNSVSYLGAATSQADYKAIDPNDGKSSPQMMNFLKTYGSH